MTGREQLELADIREYVYKRDGGKCRKCGKRVPFPGELAHRIPQSKDFLAVLGEEIIYHPLNMALVCMRRDKCNSGMSIRNKPAACRELVAEIKKAIVKECDQ
jgi:5-methylcytosine-specific restriction endonuclease McrA